MLFSRTLLITPLIAPATPILNGRTAAFVATAASRLTVPAVPSGRFIMTLRATIEVDINAYLDSIESEVHREGPILSKRLSDPNRKPMIRTLLGVDDKVAFDATIRTARQGIKYRRLEMFVRDVLSPLLSGDRLDKVPGMPGIIEEALSRPPSNGASAFRSLGTGRIYRGDALAMVQDVAPEAVAAYLDATTVLTDDEVMEFVIESHREYLDEERIEAALRCLYDFPHANDCLDDYADEADSCCPKLNGRECEKACVEFLEGRRDHGQKIVLENVYVNHKSSSARPKYHINNRRNKSGNNGSSTGIIWTSVGRKNICSEFDAVVVNGEAGRVVEIWEAKYSVSPSTLWDAVTKKVLAIRQLQDDEEAVLSFGEKDIPIKSPESNEDAQLTFGIFGFELLPPKNSVGQLKAMAVANALSKDVDTVLRALEGGFVEVDRDRALHDIHILREELRKASDDFHISLHICSNLAEDV